MRPPKDNDNRTEQEKNEFYGPIDGVKPVDYPDTYQILMRSICMRQEEEIIYVGMEFPYPKFCEQHYEGQEGVVRRTRWHAISSPLHDLNWIFKSDCLVCKRSLFWLRPAHQCRICIEEFLVNKRTFERKFREEQNIEIESRIRF